MVDPTLEDFRRRNAVIVHMIDNELRTMTAVAKWFGVSKQRVQQIYSKEKDKNV
jgi:DNA-directed RNA polymerase sigma subunit (sigma70/sigma32)